MSSETADKVAEKVIATAQTAGRVDVPEKRFVTLEILSRRLEGSTGGSVELAENEFLTPAATDLLEQRHLSIARTKAATTQPTVVDRPEKTVTIPVSGVVHSTAPAVGAVGLIVERADEKVESVLRAIVHDGIRFTDFMGSDCWIENLRGLCAGVVDGRLAMGVAILPYAANGMVLANKIRGIRAVQGTCIESVSAAVRHVGANVLILEHKLSTFFELRAMTRTFITDRMVCGAAVKTVAAIGELEKA